jgi:hypothetical protein
MERGNASFWNASVGRTLRVWLPLAAVLTVICGLVYIVAQQELRRGADDPQIQMAEDAAVALRAGQSAGALVPSAPVDMATSLAPYLIIFDTAGHAVAGSARLNGITPTLPSGVFTYVQQAGEERLSWQPQAGVRSAAVVTRVDGAAPGFVLAGRSLREVEDRIMALQQLVALGWLAGLAGLAVLCGGVAWATRAP